VLGGLGSISGATIAAILLTLLPEWLRDLPTGQTGLAILATFALVTCGLARSWLLAGLTLIGYLIMRHLTALYGFNPSDYRLVIYSIMLIVTMTLRPQGLFGVHELWDYLPRRWRWWQRGVNFADRG
jgi:branched-chain amino acid transport system permease protein